MFKSLLRSHAMPSEAGTCNTRIWSSPRKTRREQLEKASPAVRFPKKYDSLNQPASDSVLETRCQRPKQSSDAIFDSAALIASFPDCCLAELMKHATLRKASRPRSSEHAEQVTRVFSQHADIQLSNFPIRVEPFLRWRSDTTGF